MSVLGWLAGRTVVEFIADYDHWVAFTLLALVSGRMLWESFRSERSHQISFRRDCKGYFCVQDKLFNVPTDI